MYAPLADAVIARPSPNRGYGRAIPRRRAVTWHISQGSLASTLDWLCNPRSDASANFVIGRAGELYELVPPDEAAWAHGKTCDPDLSNPIIAQTVNARVNPNLVAISIECVGYSGYGHTGSLTQPQADALQRLTAWCCLHYRLTCDRTHVLGHYQWDSCTRHDCPGFAPEEWREWIARAASLCYLWRGW